VIPFAEWLPDQPEFNNPGSTVIKNVIPAAVSYKPVKGLAVQSNALDSPCLGAVSGIDTSGNVNIYAGDSSQLYKFSADTFSDASRSGTASTAYSVGANENWEFAQFGNVMTATHVDDPVQSITMGGTNFADLIVSTLKPQARHVTVIKNFLVLGNTRESGTNYPQRVRWSALDDASDFDASQSTQSDFQDLYGEGGWVMKVVGGESGLIFQERAIWRMTYIGSPFVFQFDQVEINRGTIAKNSVARYGTKIYFLAEDGFFAINTLGGESQAIGKERVDEYFFNDFDPTYPHKVVGVVDPENSVIWWAYPGPANNDGTPNRLLLYNWVVNRWSRADIDVQWLFRTARTGVTLDDLDTTSSSIDSLVFSLDSRIWAGDPLQVLAGFDTSNKLGHFSGSALASTLETSEVQLFPGRRAFVSLLRPYVEGESVVPTVQVGMRDKHTDSVSYGSAVSLDSLGEAAVRSNGRFTRFRVNTTGTFEHAQGIEILAATPVGKR
jgi:hypothetical protein